jgi:hypothetical protein
MYELLDAENGGAQEERDGRREEMEIGDLCRSFSGGAFLTDR